MTVIVLGDLIEDSSTAANLSVRHGFTVEDGGDDSAASRATGPTAAPTAQAADVHALSQALGGPVEMFASSGGAVTSLALVAAHPQDVLTLVAPTNRLLISIVSASALAAMPVCTASGPCCPM